MLLLALPVAIGLSLSEAKPAWRFAFSALAIIPLAGYMGRATEQLAHRMGSGIGGLLNATFGNAAELILALLALRRGLDDVVKASLTGSIIGNLLLVMGASFLAGGLKYPIQRFNRTAASAGSVLMVLAAMGMLVPAIFHYLVGPGAVGLEHKLSVSVCGLLILAYALNLIFSLGTHREHFNGKPEPTPAQLKRAEERGEADEPAWTIRTSTVVLLVATSFVAWMSEILVGAVEATGHELGLTGVFMGVVVVAIVGNAAEHSSAVLMAMKNHADLSVNIAMGSALQIALFVAPVLVFSSYLRAEPMDLLFSTLEVAALILTVVIARMVAEDGESNWLEGAMLLIIYAILGLAFFFLPAPPGSHHGAAPAAVHAPG
ncbi:calcium/proton exchanger [Isosphaeraceae bacterium EP7]